MTLEPTYMIYMITASHGGSPVIFYCAGEDVAMKRYELMIARGYAPRVYVECRRVSNRSSHESLPVSSVEPDRPQATDNASKSQNSTAHRTPHEALESLHVDENGLIQSWHDKS